MKVDLYEKIWMWGVGVVLAGFFTTTAVAAFGGAVHPPSHVETIDPTKVFADSRFSAPGVRIDAEGRVQVNVVGMSFAWLPAQLRLPANTPITFNLTSIDVVHGYQIVRTNGQTMLIPGYVSRFTTSFEAGDYLVVCNEYCGVGHHQMYAKMTVVPANEWQLPGAPGTPAAPTGSAASNGGAHGNH